MAGGLVTAHAIERLRERYGIEITYFHLKLLARMLGHPDAREDAEVLRYVGVAHGGAQEWEVDLGPLVGRGAWARCLYDPGTGNVITFLPPDTGRGDGDGA